MQRNVKQSKTICCVVHALRRCCFLVFVVECFSCFSFFLIFGRLKQQRTVSLDVCQNIFCKTRFLASSFSTYFYLNEKGYATRAECNAFWKRVMSETFVCGVMITDLVQWLSVRLTSYSKYLDCGTFSAIGIILIW